LSLVNCGLTFAGIGALGKMQNLEKLNLSGFQADWKKKESVEKLATKIVEACKSVKSIHLLNVMCEEDLEEDILGPLMKNHNVTIYTDQNL
jgi:hypothetical protein